MSYTVRGVTVATAATADHAIFAVWNPHATQRIKLIQWGVFKVGAGTAGDALRLRRISARGTAGSTVTPVIAHHSENAIAPPSGFLLDLAAYTVQPTLVAGDLGLGWVSAAIAAAGVVSAIPGGIIIPPSAGIAFLQAQATIWPISHVSVTVLEDW
jgi:hypothetical protein